MITLFFFETGDKIVINQDITILSNEIGENSDICETIVLDGINTKHCAIVKDDQVYKIIDLCSSGTKLYINNELIPFTLKPLKYYELRDKDRIYIGKHEILFSVERGTDQNEKRSFYIPETQPSFETTEISDFNEEDHVEIPETQCMETQIPDMIDDVLEPKVQKTEESNVAYEVETQPAFNILPRFTRSRKQKQEQIKPKSVPLAVFDCSSPFTAETQDYVPVKMDRSKLRMKLKKESQSSSSSKQLKNSILLSEEELSDNTDDERCDINVIDLGEKKNIVPVDENSLNITLSDDLGMDRINSVEFDSQFLECLNGVKNDENEDCDLMIESINGNIKKEENSSTTSIKREGDHIDPRPKKKPRIFKYAIDDGDDMF